MNRSYRLLPGPNPVSLPSAMFSSHMDIGNPAAACTAADASYGCAENFLPASLHLFPAAIREAYIYMFHSMCIHTRSAQHEALQTPDTLSRAIAKHCYLLTARGTNFPSTTATSLSTMPPSSPLGCCQALASCASTYPLHQHPPFSRVADRQAMHTKSKAHDG